MSSQRKLNIQGRSEFTKYLDSFSKINDSFIGELEDSKLSIITASPDNTLIAYGEYACSSNYNISLNIPDSKKLVRVLDTVNTEDVELILNNNSIEYRGTSIKFKYHLFEEGFITKPALSVEKIKNFTHDISFKLTKQSLQTIIKGSSFITETNKLYLYTDNGKLIGELTDKARHNTDCYSIALCDADFHLQPIPVNFDNIRLMTLLDDIIDVNINTQYGVLIFTMKQNNTKLSYILTSLTQ